MQRLRRLARIKWILCSFCASNCKRICWKFTEKFFAENVIHISCNCKSTACIGRVQKWYVYCVIHYTSCPWTVLCIDRVSYEYNIIRKSDEFSFSQWIPSLNYIACAFIKHEYLSIDCICHYCKHICRTFLLLFSESIGLYRVEALLVYNTVASMLKLKAPSRHVEAILMDHLFLLQFSRYRSTNSLIRRIVWCKRIHAGQPNAVAVAFRFISFFFLYFLWLYTFSDFAWPTMEVFSWYQNLE